MGGEDIVAAVLTRGQERSEWRNQRPERVGDSGVYFAVGDTYNFDPDWYGSHQ